MVPLTNGGYRNHCPACLWSRHVDGARPGDRAWACGGPMRPVGLDHRAGKGWMVVHRCEWCGGIRRNRLARDTVQPDDPGAVLDVARFGCR